MQRIDTDRTFETSDLYLACYLIAGCGLRLWATDKHDPGRVVFVLSPRPAPEDLAAYAEERATVNVGAWGRALRKLKRAIHSDQEDRR